MSWVELMHDAHFADFGFGFLSAYEDNYTSEPDCERRLVLGIMYFQSHSLLRIQVSHSFIMD